MKTPDEYLKGWFEYLAQVRDCTAQISNDVADDITTFAAQEIATLLSADMQKSQLSSCISMRCGLYVPDKAFTMKTALNFFEYIYQPLHGFVQAVFKEQAGPAYTTTLPSDFDLLVSNVVFPTDGTRQLLIKALRSDLPDTWFPNTKVGKLLVALASDKKVKEAVDLVATPGDGK